MWDQKEQAQAYNGAAYPEELKELAKVVDGTPRVQTCQDANSTAHKIAARPAA